MPYKTFLNPPFNVIFVESYEYTPKEDNYLMKTLISYLKFLHYIELNVFTFMELYPSSTIKSIKEDDVKFWTLFEKCTMACFASFCRNHSTFVIRSANFFWLLPSNVFLDFPISLIYMLSLFPAFHKYYLLIFKKISMHHFLRKWKIGNCQIHAQLLKPFWMRFHQHRVSTPKCLN